MPYWHLSARNEQCNTSFAQPSPHSDLGLSKKTPTAYVRRASPDSKYPMEKEMWIFFTPPGGPPSFPAITSVTAI